MIAPTHRRPESLSGFSLPEALFAVTLVGVIFVALYTGIASGFRRIGESQENLRATQIIMEKFEELRLYNWEQINAPGFIPSTFTARFAPNETSPGITYTGTVTIADAPVTEVYSNDLRSVRIDLSWVSGGAPRSRSFTSFVARYGLQRYIL